MLCESLQVGNSYSARQNWNFIIELDRVMSPQHPSDAGTIGFPGLTDLKHPPVAQALFWTGLRTLPKVCVAKLASE